jgi:hypothetical protein
MEMMNERMNLVATMDPFIGKYFSIDHIRRNVLKQTEEEYKEIDEQIEKEMADGKIADPNAMVDPATGMPMDGGAMPPEAGAAGGALPPEEGGAQVGEGGVEPDPKDFKKAEF